MTPAAALAATALIALAGCQTVPHSIVRAANEHIARDGAHDRMTVLSFNMQHRDEPDQLNDIAMDFKTNLTEVPDFICLQEVKFKRRGGHDSTAAVLAQQLGYHCRGTKRSSDREGIAILSRYPFEYYASRELDAQTIPLLLGFKRISVMGEFMVENVGRVRVVNVHLTNWGFEQHIREKQLKETLEWIAARERTAPAAVTFLGGDFNFEPNSQEMALLSDMKLTGGMKFENFNNIHVPTKGSKGDPHRRIDYIFVAATNQRLELKDEDILWEDGLVSPSTSKRYWPSDHLPVFHEYVWTGPAMDTAAAEAEPSRGAS